MGLFRWFRRLFGFSAAPGGSARSSASPTSHPPPPALPYSSQYEVIVRQGHEHPTPFFSPPALVWHVGVWPRREQDPHGLEVAVAGQSPAQPPRSHSERKTWSDTKRRAWLEAIDEVLGELQAIGRRPPGNTLASRKSFIQGAIVPESGAIVFTMWWRSPGAGAIDPAAIRVKVHCNLTPDHATFSFYMDVKSYWGQPASEPTEINERRTDILTAAKRVREICHGQAQTHARRNYAQLDPDALSADEDTELLRARNLLYVDAWELFMGEAGIDLDRLATPLGEVFANFRGVALSVPPAPDAEDANARFPRFSQDPKFDADGAEANAVVDTYWPFVRRIVPVADFREFVACGLMSWRAIYMTALASPPQWDPDEERLRRLGDKLDADIGVGCKPTHGDFADSCARANGSGSRTNNPVRYLMLSKENARGESLNPRQLGRIVERINALGTLRLYALKDWPTMAAADPKIRILGQELDQITRKWSEMRGRLDRYNTVPQFQVLARKLKKNAKSGQVRSEPPQTDLERDADGLGPYVRNVYVPSRFRWLRTKSWATVAGVVSFEGKRLLRREETSRALDIKYEVLAEISRDLETRLIEIGAELDRLGENATGGLHFRINRSAIAVAEFRQLLELLQVGNIQTWTSYDQFVKRGLVPAFAYIGSVGQRIHSLRERLIAVLETIETSALVGQSSATRYNTGELRRLMNFFLIMAITYLIINKDRLFLLIGKAFEYAGGIVLAQGILAWLSALKDWILRIF